MTPRRAPPRARRDPAGGRRATLLGALAKAARGAVHLDRSKLSPLAATRAAVGFAVPLAVGAATGEVLMGVTASIGALAGGFASLQGTYRSRADTVVAATAGMALSAFVGATIGHLAGAAPVIVAAWGFGAGLLVAFGQAATIVGLQSVVGLVVFSQFALSPTGAARQGALVLAGGLLQAVLIVVVWPLRRFPAERRALAAVYHDLAAYSASLPGAPTTLPDPGGFGDAGSVLADPQPFAPRARMVTYQDLLNQAERLRLELSGLARDRQLLSGAGDEATAGAVNAALGAAAA
ncbi:MAG TPA: hypothetical protein VE152_04400, partial [Acidimicrobiales bacterium]|nr:hypothetical protein [Acidimicrobiales bacterium]